jgi:hypothetical protein
MRIHKMTVCVFLKKKAWGKYKSSAKFGDLTPNEVFLAVVGKR